MEENTQNKVQKLRHYTCTSTQLGRDCGDVERVPEIALEEKFQEMFGHGMSSNSVIRIIQSEQVLARLARNGE